MLGIAISALALSQSIPPPDRQIQQAIRADELAIDTILLDSILQDQSTLQRELRRAMYLEDIP